jgi:serine/threonine-protein kinase
VGKTVRFGRYLLERRLAIGGMAEVFLGRIEGPEGFQKKVVVKRILPHLQDDDNHVKMFLDEARLAARFDHPNLIQVYELARIEDQYCLAMEYIEGEDVAAILDESLRLGRQIPVDIAAYIVSSAAEGLHYVHELTTENGDPLNVVHRDISPANVIVTWRGGIKIVDFGIAKHEISTSQTVAGTLKGKFSYMSPEQARGETVDRRSDIFSLGTILYELLTVTPCFAGGNQIEILDNVINVRYRPPREIRPEIPARVETLLSRLLTADRNNRYPTADDVRADLKRFMADTNMPTPSEVGNFLSNLFGRPSKNVPNRVATAIQDVDEVPVTDEYSSPDVIADEDSYRLLKEQSQSYNLKKLREVVDSDDFVTDISDVSDITDLSSVSDVSDITDVSGVSDEIEPFDIPSQLMKQPVLGGRRRSTLSKVADRLREPRYWPTTLLIIGVTMAIGALALVMVYRAALGMPWTPDELLSEVVGGSASAPTPDEELGQAALQILTEPPGALVTIDGDAQEGRTPLTVDNLSVGLPHRVVVELPGYSRESKEVSLPEDVGMETLNLELRRLDEQPVSAMVKVTSAPPGATVIIDSSETAHTTPAEIEVEPGAEIAVSARLKGYSAKTVKVTPAAGEQREVAIALAKASAASTGLLDIDSEPRGDVYIGGRRIGPAPVRRYKLPAGSVVVQVKNKKLGLSKSLKLDIPAGGHVQRRVVFRKGQVIFNVAPWADVYLGKKKLGTTPMPPISLYEGTYAIKLVNDELGVERVVYVSVKSGKLKKVVEKLR